MVIVVRLVSATRRPTEHWAHHDRDGRPATKGARSSARSRAGVLRPSVGRSGRRPDRALAARRASRQRRAQSGLRGHTFMP